MKNNLMARIGEPAMMECLAEECSELAKAALKVARIIRGENATPVHYEEAKENYCEEMADVILCICEITNEKPDDFSRVLDWYGKKRDRMNRRFINLDKGKEITE